MLKKFIEVLYKTRENNFYLPTESIEPIDVEKVKSLAEIQIDTMNKILIFIEKDGGFDTIKERIKTAYKKTIYNKLATS
jgi:hypothetical protein